jgi:hypothetical protein
VVLNERRHLITERGIEGPAPSHRPSSPASPSPALPSGPEPILLVHRANTG